MNKQSAESQMFFSDDFCSSSSTYSQPTQDADSNDMLFIKKEQELKEILNLPKSDFIKRLHAFIMKYNNDGLQL